MMPAANPTSSSLAATSASPPMLAPTTPGVHAKDQHSVHRQGKKRGNDFGVPNGQRAGPSPSFSVGIPAASSQLPTPQHSPITPDTNVLTRQLDHALAVTNPQTYSMVDEFRIARLLEACKDNDVFFIVTHVIFCAWSCDQHHTVLSQLGLNQSHVFGLMTLQHFLHSNQGLSQEVAAVLSRFPMSLHLYLGGTSPQALVLAGQVNRVKRFLSTLQQNWTTIWSLFSQREWPPCPIQIKHSLQLRSVTLEKCVYMYFVTMRPTDPRWFMIAMRLFDQALKDPAQTPLSVDELGTVDESQLSKSANDFYKKYCINLGNFRSGQYQHLPGQPLQLQGQPLQRPGQPLQRPGYPLQLSGQPLQPQEHPLQPQLQPPGRPLQPPGQSLQLQGENTQVSALASSRVGQQSPVHVMQQAGHLINQQAGVGWPQVRILPNVARPIRSSHSHVAQLPLREHQNQAPSTNTVTTTAHSIENPYRLSGQFLPVNQYTNHQPHFYTFSQSQEGPNSCVQAQVGAQMPQTTSTGMTQEEVPHDLLFWRDGNFTLPVFAVPDPDRYALHQAHLRTPTMDKVDPVARINQTKWYQYVETIISRSKTLDVDSPMAQWTFEVPEQYWARKTQGEEVIGDSFTKHRKIVNGSTQFRLKSIGSDKKQTVQEISMSEYSTRPTQWPPHLSASVNGDMGIDFRRKVHYSTDLPTDVTDVLQKGVNEVVVCINFDPGDRPMSYLMAIEVISVAHREAIRAMVGQADAAEVVASIVATLRPTPGAGDDEDLVVAQTSISIDLVDPFMSCIWSTPTRSKACRHRECFDLDAYLDGRTDQGGVTNPDQWKCPICKKDARPQMLVVDGFLSNVRKDLEAVGKLDTRAIIVSREGTWEIKPESSTQAKKRFKNSTQTPDSHTHRAGTPEELSRVAGEPSPTTKPEPDILVILDDDD
ncbi:uncharacterized protein PV06_04714 [Exophiala oligosperma]|uniref:SP-RING-type domain-containing protein n=2 Tax=Exophiala oligosperma TaxID=215243 RepID=A0A0D2E736_9EURO|nr:uncharacterized protein PV06_04714 [Exophiala oligosperma]KIW43629.1 hypothetical protein PV06_04714 [Exophiala oligosperma]